MKRTILTLCVLIALSSVADAAHAKECYDTTTGKTIFTNNPPPGAICEGDPGPALTPQERQQNARERQQIEAEQASRKTEGNQSDANAKIEALINQLMNDPRNLQTQAMGGGVIKTGGLKQHVMEQIVELRKAQLRNQGSTPEDNQQADMEDKMKRQQREMKAKTETPPVPRGAINVRTGEYYPPGAGGIIEPKTGILLPDVGGGYVDPRTGKFIPKF